MPLSLHPIPPPGAAPPRPRRHWRLVAGLALAGLALTSLWPAPVSAQVVPNPFGVGDWFTQLLANAVNHLLLSLIDGLFRWLASSTFVWTTTAADTYANPALAGWRAAGQAVAATAVTLVLVWNGLDVLMGGIGASRLTAGPALVRVIVAGVAAGSAPWWTGQVIELNNGLAAAVGPDLTAPPGTDAAQRFSQVLALAGLPPEQRQSLVGQLTPCLGAGAGTACQDNVVGRLLVATLFGQSDPSQTLLLLLFTLAIGVLLLLLVLQLLLRLVVLNLLLIVAPVALVCWGHPGLARVTAIWTRWFVPTVFVQSLQVLAISASREWMQVGAEHGVLMTAMLALASVWLALKLPGLLGTAYGAAQSWSGGALGAASAVVVARRLAGR